MKTALCRALSIDVPIIQAPIGGAAGPELAAAVSNAGGVGTIALTSYDAATARDWIRKVRSLTSKPFCANFILAYPGQYEENLEIALEERVPAIFLYWGDPKPYVEPAHRAGTVLILQVGSVDEAKRAADAGVDIIIAQGWEAGGHVRGMTALMPLIPTVVDAVAPTPVVAAGGIADGRGLAAALALGAAGVCIGTRFIASDEAWVPEVYQHAILEGGPDDTVHTLLFSVGWPNAPHRALRNSTYRSWEAAGRPPDGQRPGEGEVLATDSFGNKIRRYEAYTIRKDFEGDIEALSMWAGQGIGLVTERKPAGEIVTEIAEGARRTLTNIAAQV